MTNQDEPVEAVKLEAVDNRRIALLRMLLAVSAFLIIFIDPSEPDKFVELTYFILLLYCGYSSILYLFRIPEKVTFISEFSHWIDVFWFSVLISLSSGTSSIFFFFYLFAILIAAFRWGFSSGVRVSVVSTVVFTLIGLLPNISGEFELNRLLLRPIYLLGLGYLISYWGGRELLLRRRLDLLSEVNKLSNPRSGTVKSIGSILESVRRFYDADSCLLLLEKDSEYPYNWLEAERSAGYDIYPEKTDAGTPLLELPDHYSIFFDGKRGLFNNGNTFQGSESQNLSGKPQQNDISRVLADLLDARSFVSIPVNRQGRRIGRIYVTAAKDGFRSSDIDFLNQLVNSVFPSIDNIRLLDSLASDAIDRQLQKISYDIHDSTIQPYIGLKLGLEALELKADPDGPLSPDIRNLINMADTTIADLRHFVVDLKKPEKKHTGDVLAFALEQQASKFKEYYGINVAIENECDLSHNDRLAAEIFQMVAEGLSNIRRHTGAKEATIGVTCEGEDVVLVIENHVAVRTNEFLPKSLAARTGYLGGRLDIKCGADFTRVTLKVPKSVEIK